MADTIRPKSRMPLAVTLIAALLALAAAAWVIFAPSRTVNQAPPVAVPEASAPAPMPKPQPAP